MGWDQYSPFDKIIVTAGSPVVPQTLKKQLAVKGRMVVPVGSMSSQVLKVITKTAEDEFEIEEENEDIPRRTDDEDQVIEIEGERNEPFLHSVNRKCLKEMMFV